MQVKNAAQINYLLQFTIKIPRYITKHVQNCSTVAKSLNKTQKTERMINIYVSMTLTTPTELST